MTGSLSQERSVASAGIPAISSYDPSQVWDSVRPSTGPARTWRPEPHRTLLLVHDMQRFFLRSFPADTQPLDTLLERAGRLRAAADGIPVAYTVQPGSMTPQQRGLLADFWGPGMRAAEADRAVVAEVAPREGDTMLTKWRYSAFHHTDLLRMMREQGRDQLVLCGVYAHIGVLATAIDAFSHDIQTFLVADAVADFSADWHRLALQYAAERCAAVVRTQDVLDAWSGQVGR